MIFTLIEAIEGTKEASLLEAALMRGIDLGLLSPLKKSLFARVSTQDQREVEVELSSSLHADQAEFALKWSTKQINFVRHHGKKSKRNKEAKSIPDHPLFPIPLR